MYFFYFYPLGLSSERRRPPWLTMALSVFMLMAFLWLRYFPDRLALDPWDLVFFPGNGRTYTILTAIFLHSGWLHLLGNLAYFQVFGAALEDRLGRPTFGVVFLMLGIFGNLMHGLVAAQGWFGQYGVGVLGASGAIAGLLGLGLVRFRSARVEVAWWLFAPLMGQNKAGRTPVPLPLAVGAWLLLQVVHSLLADETGSGVSYGAHLGGFVMGLVLAMVLGQGRLGKQEGLAGRARAYFRDGAYHAAEGEWLAYLEMQPQDLAARVELARARILTGQTTEAERGLRTVFQRYLRAGKVSRALEVFSEARRADLVSSYTPAELARAAHFQEKQFAFGEAAQTLALLFRRYPDSSEGQRALVRLVMLHMGKIADREALRHWIAIARQHLPAGGWREFLEGELRAAGGPDADANPELRSPALHPARPGS